MSEGIIQQKSASEGQIPESSGRIEEANNNVVGLKRIDDSKGNRSSSSSSKKKDYSICRWQEDHGITRELLEQHFDKNRSDAAKALRVSPSTLKRACRDLGIKRWPTHNRKSSNSPLNEKQDVQAAAVNKHKVGATALQVNITMPVKATYQNDTVAFPLSSSSTLKYLEEQLESRFKIPAHKFSIKYQDGEDEWISIMCDSDLMYCMNVLRSCGKSVIRMRVTPKSLECNPNPSSISPCPLNEKYSSSPVLPIQAAQPPPNAASPVGSWKGVCREILEPPNTTPILLSEGNTTVGSCQQRVSDHSFNIECFNQEELFNYSSSLRWDDLMGNLGQWARQFMPLQPNDVEDGLPHMPVQLPVDMAVSSPTMNRGFFTDESDVEDLK